MHFVQEEKKNGDPFAAIIHQLKLEKNTITLLLSDIADDAEEDG